MLQTVLFAFVLYQQHPKKLWTEEKKTFSPTEIILNHSDQCPYIKKKLEIEFSFSIISSLMFLLLGDK